VGWGRLVSVISSLLGGEKIAELAAGDRTIEVLVWCNGVDVLNEEGQARWKEHELGVPAS
jgi:hypothetical protein